VRVTTGGPDDTTAGQGRPRRRRLLIGGLLLVVALGVAAVAVWVPRQVAAARDQAIAVQDALATTEAAVRAADPDAVVASLPPLRAAAATLAETTQGPLVELATRLPRIGAPAAAAQDLATTLDAVLVASAPLDAELPGLLPGGDPAGVLVDPGSLERSVPALRAVAAAADTGATRLATYDPAALPAELGDVLRQAGDVLPTLAETAASAADAAPTVAGILGGDGERRYAVALQNGAEARGTGGFVGAWAVVAADEGRVRLAESFANDAITAVPIPYPEAVPPDTALLYGDDLGEWAGLNLSPHFPWTGRLVTAGWPTAAAAAGLDTRTVDGVLALDQVAVAALLAGTGPLTVQGITVDRDTVADFLTFGLYVEFPFTDDAPGATPAKDVWVLDLVDAVATAFTAGDVDWVALAAALRDPAVDGRFLAWFPEPTEQGLVAEAGLAGILPTEPGPFVTTALQNGGGNKLDHWLATSVDYRPGRCLDDYRVSRTSVTLRNEAPTEGLPSYTAPRSDLLPGQRVAPGAQRTLLFLYGPVGSELLLAGLGGRDVLPVAAGTDREHPVWRFDVEIPPGASRTITVQLLEPATPALGVPAGAVPVVQPQVMAIPQDTAAGQAPACTR
jgi:hypothetical protein